MRSASHRSRRQLGGATVALLVAVSACGREGVRTEASDPAPSVASSPSPPGAAASDADHASPAPGARPSVTAPSGTSAAEPTPGAPGPEPAPSQTETPAASSGRTEPDDPSHVEERQDVIVDLAVAWRPEHELSESERQEQRARITAAQDEILRDLGEHGRLRRRLTESAQLAVSVDPDGRRILDTHRLVAAVNEDEPAGPHGN